jgi:hypothetical protein
MEAQQRLPSQLLAVFCQALHFNGTRHDLNAQAACSFE